MTQKIIVISAPSGGGKTTLIQALLKEHSHIQNVITHTTRPIRENEINNIHYHFVNQTQFESMIKHNELVEWARVYDHYYGTSLTAIHKVMDEHKIPILNIDVQGAENVKKIYGKQVTTIFILPPNLNELEQRLKARGDSHDSIKKRLDCAEAEMTHAQDYDFVVTNDDFNLALQRLVEIVNS